jgi:hypothetical protein
MLEWHYRRSFGLDVGFIDHFNTQLVITPNYSASLISTHFKKSLAHTPSLFQSAVSS